MRVLTNVESMSAFSPELVLSAGVVLVLLVDMVQRGSSRRVAGGLATATLIAALAALLATAPAAAADSLGLFGGLVARDRYGDFWKVLFLLTTFIVGLMATRSRDAIDRDRGDGDAGEFYALALAICLGLFVMASATDLLLAYLGLEMVSILSFALAGFNHRDRRSAEAALKYAIYGGVASGCMLYGLSFLYGMSGSTSMAAVQAAMVAASPGPLILAVALTLAGLGYKIAVVPFHQWCPDVYEGAPTPVTAFLSVGPKAAGFALLVRFFHGAVADDLLVSAQSIFGSQPWPTVLAAVAVATMTLGNLVALVQSNVKRLLAYSSIAHAGYVMLGMLVVGPDGRVAMMFYLFAYLFMNLGAFAVVAAMTDSGLGENLSDFHRLAYRAPLVAACMVVYLISLTGLPPTAGFAGKFVLFAALVREGGTMLWTVAVIAVLNSAISLFYYARVMRAMYFGHEGVHSAGLPVTVAPAFRLVLLITAVPVVALGVFWTPLIDWARASLVLWQP
jgi:NADH-quinone oxidoreductase subunit N